jgi:hypothetical protein
MTLFQPRKEWVKRIQYDWSLLEKDLPGQLICMLLYLVVDNASLHSLIIFIPLAFSEFAQSVT